MPEPGSRARVALESAQAASGGAHEGLAPQLRQFIRFCAVGLIQNGLNVGTFAILVALGVPFLFAAVLSALVALSASFALNRRWTFPGSTDRTTGRALRFAAIWVTILLIGLPELALLVEVAHLPRVLSQAIVILVGAPLSYLAQRRWTFASHDER